VPYHHDGRLLTLDAPWNSSIWCCRPRLTDDEKQALVAFLRAL
jgi:hypothetical protein